MRLFYLQNESGIRIPLNNETGIFLTEPEGLGLEFGDTFADIGEGFFRMVSKKHTQKVISAKLNFTKDCYLSYNNFTNWCVQAKQLYFIYKPSLTEYYIHVEIESFEKTEINKFGYLSCALKLKYLSPWYIPFPTSFSTIGLGNRAFRWNVSRFGNGDMLSGMAGESYSVEIQPGGHLPGAIKLKYVGRASNPSFTLIGAESGIEYGKCLINKEFPDQSTIELSTMYEDSYVKSYDLIRNETNLLQYLDLTHEPFFKVPLNERCILKIEDDGSLNGQLSGFIYFYYRSV